MMTDYMTEVIYSVIIFNNALKEKYNVVFPQVLPCNSESRCVFIRVSLIQMLDHTVVWKLKYCFKLTLHFYKIQ